MKKWIKWLKAAAIRAAKTAVQAALGVVGVSVALEDIQWQLALSSAVLAGIASLVTSVVGIPEANDGESLIDTIKASSDASED